MKFETTYGLGETVVIKHDPDRMKRMITQLSIHGNGNYFYCLSCGSTSTWHYECEIERPVTREKKVGFKR